MEVDENEEPCDPYDSEEEDDDGWESDFSESDIDTEFYGWESFRLP